MRGGTSYRKLAKKYDVSFQILQNVAKQEKWTALLRRAKDETNTKLVNTIAKENAKRMVKIDSIADKLLDKIEVTIDSLDVIDSQALKHFTSALKDIKDIKGVKSDADLAEQEARINKLRKDCEDEQKDTTCEVVMGEGVDEYAN
jgi:predicted metal-dependent peptidase